MPYFKAVLLISLCIAIVVCMDQRTAWKMHNRLASEKVFPCKVPQPRVFYLKDLLKEKEWHKYKAIREKIKPAGTVLHRCGSAGCCSEWNERCLPTKVQNLTLVFGIIRIRRRIEYIPVKVKNHTECACHKMDDNDIKK